MVNEYDIGDVVRLTGAFSQSSVAVDPTAVSMIVRRPDGIKTTYVYGTDLALVKSATGTYYLDYTPVMAGQHWYRWVTTGTGASAGEERFVVSPANTTE